jgi:DNA helicase-2/ATP-dependent DNA helicase PcrA
MEPTTAPWDQTEEKTGPTEAQHTAIEEFERPVLVISQPGTGKTTVVTLKYARAVEKWGHGSAIAVTFTRKAASEIRERLEALGCRTSWKEGDDPATRGAPTAGTFHAIAARVLAMASTLGLYDGPVIMATEDEIAQIFESCRIGDAPRNASKSDQRTLKAALARTKNDAMMPVREGYATIDGTTLRVVPGLPNPGSPTHNQLVRYQEELHQQRLLDYDDALLQATLMLEQHREQLLPGLKAVIADEFQDVNALNFRMLEALARNISLTCCGDDDQAIYHWRGARVEHMRNFAATHRNTVTVVLQENFRSAEGIPELADRIMRNVPGRLPKTRSGRTPVGRTPLTWHPYKSRSPGYRPMGAGYEHGLAEFTATTCGGILAEEKASPQDAIVLVRENEHARLVRRALEGIGIPSRVSSPNALDSHELRCLSSWLRLLAEPWAEGPVSQLAGMPVGDRLIRDLSTLARAQGKSLIELITERRLDGKMRNDRLARVADSFMTLRQTLEHDGPTAAAEEACRMATSSGTTTNEAALDRFWRAYGRIVPMLQDGNPLPRVIEILQSGLSEDDLVGTDPVLEVSTIHAVKGRQKPLVIISAFADGIMPGRMTMVAGARSRELEDDRRLAYVAISRARRRIDVITVAGAPSILADLLREPGTEAMAA